MINFTSVCCITLTWIFALTDFYYHRDNIEIDKMVCGNSNGLIIRNEIENFSVKWFLMFIIYLLSLTLKVIKTLHDPVHSNYILNLIYLLPAGWIITQILLYMVYLVVILGDPRMMVWIMYVRVKGFCNSFRRFFLTFTSTNSLRRNFYCRLNKV